MKKKPQPNRIWIIGILLFGLLGSLLVALQAILTPSNISPMTNNSTSSKNQSTQSVSLIRSSLASSVSSSSSPSVSLALVPNTATLLKSEDLEIPVLMYHHISDLAGILATDATAVGLRVAPKVFEAQMDYLVAKKYNTVTSEDIYNYQYRGIKLPPNPILLTFDDGYRDNYIHAFPVLKKHKLIGEFALITNVIGQGEYMSWDEALDMKKDGMAFSSHSFFHCYLAGVDSVATKANGYKTYVPTPKGTVDTVDANCPNIGFGGVLDFNQVNNELKKSKETLEAKLGVKIFGIVYPYGNYNIEVMKLAQANGYYYGYTVEGQNNGNLNFDKPFKLPRTRVFGQQALPLSGFFGR